MKVGDLVKLKPMHRQQSQRTGLIVEVIDKKCWRTHELGKKVNWGMIEPEPHAVVLVKGASLTIPLIDLERVCED